MTEEQLKKRLIDLRVARERAIANANVISGQILEVEQWLAQINGKPETPKLEAAKD